MDPYLQGAIRALARRQHNNVTRAQLMKLGVGAGAIKHRLRSGRYFHVHDGVYSIGHPPRTPHERAMAAVLACGPTAALSHDSALALWGLRKHWPRMIEVTVTRDRRPNRIRTHLSANLTRKDITRHFGIPVSTLARTLRDCEPRLADAHLARTVNDALLSDYLTRSQLGEFLTRTPCRRLTPFVLTADGPTRSEFEDAFVPFCETYGLPRPRVNFKLGGYLVDAYFEEQKLIVELDGWDFHSSRRSFEADRLRDAKALARGIVTVRITWERLKGRPAEEAARLHRILKRLRRGL